MKDSILIQTLLAFSEKELEQLTFFIENPEFNLGSHSNQNIALFTLLRNKILNNDLESLDKSMVCQELFGKELKFKRLHYLENRMSELIAVIRKFITWHEVNNKWGKVFEGIASARFYKNRGLIKLQEKAISKTKAMVNRNQAHIIENSILSFWINETIFHFENLRNQRKGDLNIPDTVKSLSTFYAIKLLELSLAEVQQNRVNQEFTPSWNVMILDMRRLFRIYGYFENPTLIMLDEALVLIEDKTNESLNQIQKFIQRLNKYENKIPITTIKNLAAYARNYCTSKINKGYQDFRDLRIALYKDHLEKGWLLEDGKLIPSTFINMINIGLWSGERDWIRNLLNNYKDKISSEAAEKTYHYGATLYYSSNQQFQDARRHLNQVLQSKKFGDSRLELLVRVLEIKLLFVENDDFIDTQLHNFLMYVRRSEKVFGQKSNQNYLTFIRTVKKITSLKKKMIQKSVERKNLISSLKSIEEQLDDIIVEKFWLKEKVLEIKSIINS